MTKFNTFAEAVADEEAIFRDGLATMGTDEQAAWLAGLASAEAVERRSPALYSDILAALRPLAGTGGAALDAYLEGFGL